MSDERILIGEISFGYFGNWWLIGLGLGIPAIII
jgi:hypothetical protein